MADKKSKKSKKRNDPRLKKVARVVPARKKAKRKVARKRTRGEWLAARLVEEERDLWRFVCIAASINGDDEDAVVAADRAAKAFRDRYRKPEVIEAYVSQGL
jgi:hypothetical protein